MYNLYKHVSDQSFNSPSENLSEVLINFKLDGPNATDWFTKNGMQANPDKISFYATFSYTYRKEMA